MNLNDTAALARLVLVSVNEINLERAGRRDLGVVGQGMMIEHPNALALVRYWESIRLEDPAPTQRALHPAQIKSLLPNVFVLQRFDVHHFLFRLAGTGYCAMFGREFRTQNILSLFHGAARKYLSVMLDRIIGLPCLGVIETRAETLSGDHCYLEYVLLPLGDSAGRINRILGIVNVKDWGTASVYDRFARQSLMRMEVLDPAEVSALPMPTKAPKTIFDLAGSRTARSS